MKVAIIGLGLIGGSLAIGLKKNHSIYGVDNKREHQKQALELGLIKKNISINEINKVDVVIIAVPVDVSPQLTLKVL